MAELLKYELSPVSNAYVYLPPPTSVQLLEENPTWKKAILSIPELIGRVYSCIDFITEENLELALNELNPHLLLYRHQDVYNADYYALKFRPGHYSEDLEEHRRKVMNPYSNQIRLSRVDLPSYWPTNYPRRQIPPADYFTPNAPMPTSDWGKRVQEADAASLAGERRKAAELERQKQAAAQAEAARKSQEVLAAQRESNEARRVLKPILDRLKVRDMFESLQRSYWQGAIFEEKFSGWGDGRLSGLYALSVAYATYEYMRYDNPSALGGTDGIGGGHKPERPNGYESRSRSTRLEVYAGFYPEGTYHNPVEKYVLSVYDSQSSLEPLPGADRFGKLGFIRADDSQAYAKLDELVLRSILHRRRSNTLPHQVREKARKDDPSLWLRLFG